MDDDQRRHFNNLILLCDECHRVIDNKNNETKYPVSLLKEWKTRHESTRTYSFLNERPALLGMVINAIAKGKIGTVVEPLPRNPRAVKIDAKIRFNDIKRNKALIDEYKVFYKKINALYQEIEEQGSFRKENLLRNIRLTYLKVKGRYVRDQQDSIRIVREHADDIIEDVQEELVTKVEEQSANYSEDISFGVALVMVDAFMRCKILEEPPTA